MTAHAKLSPSGSKRWFSCAGSIVLEAAFPNSHNEYSDDGTACHHVAAECLKTEDMLAADWIGEQIAVHDKGEDERLVQFDDEMAELVQGYVDTMRAIGQGHEVHIETRVEFSRFVEVADQFGSLDFAVINRVQHEIGAYDLKTGRKPVTVQRNTQLMFYLLGLLNMLWEQDLTTSAADPLVWARENGFTNFRLGIYQPKVHSEGLVEDVLALDDLVEFAETARLKAATVKGAEQMHGKMNPGEWERIYLHPNPNEEDCAFCRAMSTCPAMSAKVQAVLNEDFKSIVDDGGCVTVDAETDSADLSLKMLATGMVEDWIKAVRAEVERRLLAGVDVPEYGLELGRQGPRKWKDSEQAADTLRKTFRIKLEDAFNLKVKSPTQVEEMTKTKKGVEAIIGPGQWKKLQSNIGRSDAKPSVKLKSVIKKPYTPEPPDASAFGAVEEDTLW